MEEQILNIEIIGLYDGVAVEFHPSTGKFVWRERIIEKTTKEYRDDFETNLLKQINNEKTGHNNQS